MYRQLSKNIARLYWFVCTNQLITGAETSNDSGTTSVWSYSLQVVHGAHWTAVLIRENTVFKIHL